MLYGKRNELISNMTAQWLRLSRVQCWLSVVWCYPGKPNSISRLISFYWHLLYVTISVISIRLPKIWFNIPNVIMYGYINKQCLKYIFLTKCDHISNTNNSIHYNFSKESRLRGSIAWKCHSLEIYFFLLRSYACTSE